MAREYFRSRLVLKAGVAVATSAAVAFAFWFPLQKAQHAHVQRITEFAAEAVRSDIADEIRSQFLAQIQLAQLYGLHGSLSTQEWDSYAGIFVAHHPGYLGLLLTDPAFRVRQSFVLGDAEPRLDTLFAINGQIRQTFQMDPQKQEALLSPAIVLRNGESGHAVVTPIYHEGKHGGFLIAVLDDHLFLEDALADQYGHGYGLSIVEDNRELYRLPAGYSDNEQQFAQNADLSLSGIKWRVHVWPQATLLGGVEPRLPELSLVTGAIIGMLLSTTLILAWTAYVKSHELGQARDQLEFRVQERTAELEAANRALEAEVRERSLAEQSLRHLSGRLLHVRDEEQRRLARELHDSTAQIVGALAINLERLQEAIKNSSLSKASTLLAQSSDLAEQATADLRTISHLLHPPILDDLGLEGALPWYTASFSTRSGIAARLNIQPELGRFSQEIELTVFRVLQSALSNIYKHSGSSIADIAVFREKDELVIRISDSGRGMPPGIFVMGGSTEGITGIGIAGMRERVRQMNGRLEIQSDASGTCITVALPTAVVSVQGRDATGEVVHERVDFEKKLA